LGSTPETKSEAPLVSNVPHGLALPLNEATILDPPLATLWQAMQVTPGGDWMNGAALAAPGWRRITLPAFTAQ